MHMKIMCRLPVDWPHVVHMRVLQSKTTPVTLGTCCSLECSGSDGENNLLYGAIVDESPNPLMPNVYQLGIGCLAAVLKPRLPVIDFT